MKKSRREFLRQMGVGAAAFLCGNKAHAATERPNVIIIFTDDQGSIDLNCYGAADLHTPNLDKLATQGIRFTQFYGAAPICSASRAGMLTGRYPHRTGVPSNAESHPNDFGTKGGLRASEITIAESLQAKGYRTGLFGKWHLGTNPGPNGSGFDESVGFLGGCIDKWSHFNYGKDAWGAGPKRHDWYRNGKETWETGKHAGDLIVENAKRFMAEAKGEPFFIYAAFGSPHYPMHPYNKYMEHYAHLPEPRRVYAALVSTVDEQIGRLLDQVDALGIRDNTIVIFQSDQGHSTEYRCNYGGGNAGPYRGAKASLFEGGIRIPAIVRWPGHIPENEVRHQLATGCDWFPTIAEFCDAPIPGSTLDGKSLAPILHDANAPSPHERWYWQFGDQWVVREGDWKLLGNAVDTTDGRNKKAIKEPLLFNLAEDMGERNNLADQHPERVARLTDLHTQWYKQVRMEK
jgi:arylsulfatase A